MVQNFEVFTIVVFNEFFCNKESKSSIKKPGSYFFFCKSHFVRRRILLPTIQYFNYFNDTLTLKNLADGSI
jgi:hypothetical protein